MTGNSEASGPWTLACVLVKLSTTAVASNITGGLNRLVGYLMPPQKLALNWTLH